jgi:hypothetical protein
MLRSKHDVNFVLLVSLTLHFKHEANFNLKLEAHYANFILNDLTMKNVFIICVMVISTTTLQNYFRNDLCFHHELCLEFYSIIDLLSMHYSIF